VAWTAYWDVLKRRWIVVLLILAVDVAAGLYLYRKANHQLGYQACLTLYVADVSSPSVIAAPSDTLDTAGQLLAGETAANFFADDILDVSQSGSVADFISSKLRPRNLPSSSPGDIGVEGSRKDRTVSLCVSNPQSTTALAAARQLAVAMTSRRGLFIGPQMAKRTYVHLITAPGVGAVSNRHNLLSLAERLFLGVLVALGAALLWEAIDPVRRKQVNGPVSTPTT
jgi:hypothetical protein